MISFLTLYWITLNNIYKIIKEDNWYLRCLFMLWSSCLEDVNIITSKIKPWTFRTNDSNWFTSSHSRFRHEIQWPFVWQPYDLYLLYVRAGQKVSVNFSVTANSSLAKLLYLPSLSNSNERCFRLSWSLLWITQRLIALFAYSPATNSCGVYQRMDVSIFQVRNQVRNLVTQTVPRK